MGCFGPEELVLCQPTESLKDRRETERKIRLG